MVVVRLFGGGRNRVNPRFFAYPRALELAHEPTRSSIGPGVGRFALLDVVRAQRRARAGKRTSLHHSPQPKRGAKLMPA